MTAVEHVEIDALRLGMPITLGPDEIGRLADIIPQPDGKHALRLITRRRSDGHLVAIPIDWVRGLRDGRIELWVTAAEISDLPEYVPPIPVSEARERVQRALAEHPTTAHAGIDVIARDGTLELRGSVPDAGVRNAASQIARTVPGVGPVRNLLGTSTDPRVSATGYGYPWLHTLIERVTHLDFDEPQLARIEDIAEQKLVDLFDVAEDAAIANGRARVVRYDLPLTKGLQLQLLEVDDLAREFKLEPLLVFLADAGIRTPFDEGLRPEIPRLMAALLILTARVVALVESPDGRATATRPSGTAIDRAEAILDLAL
jgi:hypothetical protein